MQSVTLAPSEDEWEYVVQAFAHWSRDPQLRVYRPLPDGRQVELLPVAQTLGELEFYVEKSDGPGILGIASRRRRQPPANARAWLRGEEPAADERAAVAWRDSACVDLLKKKAARLGELDAQLARLERVDTFADLVALRRVVLTQDAEAIARELDWPRADVDAMLALPLSALNRASHAERQLARARMQDERTSLKHKNRVELLLDTL